MPLRMRFLKRVMEQEPKAQHHLYSPLPIIFKLSDPKNFYKQSKTLTMRVSDLTQSFGFSTKGFMKIFIPLMLFLFIIIAFPAFAQDPSGANTGAIGDVTAAAAGKPTLDEVGAQAGHNKISINIVWTLIAGFLVMFMQAGFALVETGFTQKKNVAHTMAMNFMIYVIGLLGFCIFGFAFMFGVFGAIVALGGTPGLMHEFSVHLFGHDFGLWGNARYFLN